MEEDNTLLEFTDQLPDDNSGSRAENRFGYQINWALKRLLELEELGRDYMIIMDYHEDVIVLDSSSKVENIDFYQIKSKKMDYWLLKELTDGGEPVNEEGTNKLSILGKLLKNSSKFSKARYFYFVTDSFFSKNIIQPGSITDKGRLPFSSFNPSNQKAAKDEIRVQLGDDIADDVWDRVYFLQKQLSVESYRNELVGAITRFFESKLPNVDIKASTFYDSVIGELEEKQRFEDAITETDVLTTRKSFKHDDFKRYLDGLINYESYDQKCNTIIYSIIPELSRSEMPLKRKMKFKDLLHNRIKADYHNYSNAEIIQLKGKIKKLTAMEVFMDDDATEWTAANKVLQEIKKTYNNYMHYDDDYLLSLILLDYA